MKCDICKHIGCDFLYRNFPTHKHQIVRCAENCRWSFFLCGWTHNHQCVIFLEQVSIEFSSMLVKIQSKTLSVIHICNNISYGLRQSGRCHIDWTCYCCFCCYLLLLMLLLQVIQWSLVHLIALRLLLLLHDLLLVDSICQRNKLVAMLLDCRWHLSVEFHGFFRPEYITMCWWVANRNFKSKSKLIISTF